MAKRKSTKVKKPNRIWYLVVAIVILLLSVICYLWYTMVIAPVGRNQDVTYIHIKEGASLEDVRQQLQTKVWPRYPRLLDLWIKYKGLSDSLRVGRYAVLPEVSIIELVELLLRGPQTPVKINLSGVRTEDELVNRLSEYLMIDRVAIEQALTDTSILRLEGLNKESIRSLFFGQSYTIYWNTTGQALMDSIRSEHNRYWTKERRDKADRLGLTTSEVSTLASIVESESAKTKEYGAIARLYINRYNKGMLLQSDPTVKYAIGDFSLRRILNQHLQVESPYNTYRTKGLPPAPIRLPKQSTIDSVLNAPEHAYIYMCAKEDFSGYHNFATDYREHLANARKYQDALNKRGILK